ncbi:MAG: hypothetical protein H6R26_876 [Proteobacteria bacterium]|nr:hypothetical protein [Pseudomonadota bacterium]
MGGRPRWRTFVGFALGAALVLDGLLLQYATGANVQDAVPSQVELIVLEAWSSDASTRLAFTLAQRFANAKILTVGARTSESMDTDGCFAGVSVGEKTRSQLIAWGLAAERIVDSGPGERGTHNETLLVASWIARHAPRTTSLVVVTADFHRTRTRLTYRNALRQIDVRVLGPQLESSDADEPWWADRWRFTALVSEYFKLCYYQLRGWISPLQLVDVTWADA